MDRGSTPRTSTTKRNEGRTLRPFCVSRTSVAYDVVRSLVLALTRAQIASPLCVWNTCVCPLNYAPPSPPQGEFRSTLHGKCRVFASTPAAALPLASFRFAPPLAEHSFRLASALAPSRELCSRGGFAAKSGAHLAPFLRVSHFGRVRCSTLPRSRTEKDAPGSP